MSGGEKELWTFEFDMRLWFRYINDKATKER